MVNAVLDTTSSLRFLLDLELLDGIVLRRARFVSLLCFIGGGPGGGGYSTNAWVGRCGPGV